MWVAKVAAVAVLSMFLVSSAPPAQADDPGEETDGWEDQIVELVTETVEAAEAIVDGCREGQPETGCGDVYCLTHPPQPSRPCAPLGECPDIACLLDQVRELVPLDDCTVDGEPSLPCENYICVREGGGASCLLPVDPLGLLAEILENCPPCITADHYLIPEGIPVQELVGEGDPIAVHGLVEVYVLSMGNHVSVEGIGTSDPCQSWNLLAPIVIRCDQLQAPIPLVSGPVDATLCLGTEHVWVDVDVVGDNPGDPEVDVDVPMLRTGGC